MGWGGVNTGWTRTRLWVCWSQAKCVLPAQPFYFLLNLNFSQAHALFWSMFPWQPALNFKLAQSGLVVRSPHRSWGPYSSPGQFRCFIHLLTCPGHGTPVEALACCCSLGFQLAYDITGFCPFLPLLLFPLSLQHAQDHVALQPLSPDLLLVPSVSPRLGHIP